MIEFLNEAVKYGGGVLFLILFFFVVVLVLGFTRLYLLYVVFYTPQARALYEKIQRFIVSNQIEQAIRLCETYPKKQFLPRILRKGLQSANASAEATLYAIESAKGERVPLANRYLNWFSVIANMTTLFGLLGTISGLITAFKGAGSAAGAMRQQLLAEGISHALYATFFGLGTALVAMFFHGILATKASVIVEQVDEFAAKLVEDLQKRRANTQKSSESGH